MEQWRPARCWPTTRPPFFPAVPFTPVDGFVRTLDAIRLECWTGSDQNPGRHHLRTPGRLPLESAGLSSATMVTLAANGAPAAVLSRAACTTGVAPYVRSAASRMADASLPRPILDSAIALNAAI